jgi:hypothetical protein
MLDKTTTPGTRLVWDDLAGWLASMDELVRRPPAAKTYRDTEAHLALLTPEVLATAQSVYELDIADAYVREALPPKGQRAGHPMTALMDAVDRTRTAFVHPNGSKSARVTLSQPTLTAAAEPFVSPMDALTRYVHAAPRMVSLGAHWWRLPYALERHPYLVVPLYVQAALPTLPRAPSGRRWVIDPTDETGATIRLVSARTGRIEASTPEVSFIWFHSPHPWAWRGGSGSSPGHATAREAAERLLTELGLDAGTPPRTPRNIAETWTLNDVAGATGWSLVPQDADLVLIAPTGEAVYSFPQRDRKWRMNRVVREVDAWLLAQRQRLNEEPTARKWAAANLAGLSGYTDASGGERGVGGGTEGVRRGRPRHRRAAPGALLGDRPAGALPRAHGGRGHRFGRGTRRRLAWRVDAR